MIEFHPMTPTRFPALFMALLFSAASLAACSSGAPPQPKPPPNPRAPQLPPSPQVPPSPRVPKPLPRVVENPLGIKFVRLPGGEFVMGRAETAAALAHSYPPYEALRLADLADLADEAPPHAAPLGRSFFWASMRSPSGNSADF